MSLYGALFGGVSGLRAQSSKIGVISDNIANVNTIGYKQGQATFQTLVVNSSGGVSYQTGGVRAGTRINVDKQGLLQSTESPTDIAMSGKGMFVVKNAAEVAALGASATPLFTRAGSFRQDATGNFVNSQGYYLQGWPLDREGRLPGEAGNLNTTSFANFDSLVNVNVESVSGISQATTLISLGANLDAGEATYAGEKGTIKPDVNTANNLNLASDDILVGAEYGLASADSMRRGDRFSVSTGNGLQYTYEYGGFSIGRKVSLTGGAANMGDSGINNTALVSLAAASDIVARGTNQFDIVVPNHGLITGDEITLANFAANIGTITPAMLNANHNVVYIDANTVRITVTGGLHGLADGTNAGPGGITADIRQYDGNIFDAVSSTQAFFAQTGVGDFTPGALTFTITSPSSGARTFTYATSSPNAIGGEFNSLTSLATAINQVNGLAARVVDGRLVVGSENASEEVIFSNGDAAGLPLASPPKKGINWVSELGLSNVDAGNRRYSSLQGLANMADDDEGITANVISPLNNASVDIIVDDPLDTISFSDLTEVPFTIATAGTPIVIPASAANTTIDIVVNEAPPAYLVAGDSVYISGLTNGLGGLFGGLPNGGPYQIIATTGGSYTIRIPAAQVPVAVAGGSFNGTASTVISVAGKSNQGSPLAALGLVASLNSGAYTPQTTGVLGPKYDSGGTTGGNMASGDITAQFSRNVRIYDSLGSGHDIRFSYIKIATNEWAVEVHAIPEDDVNTALVDGQIAVGQITFNGDGSLRSLTSTLTSAITINWRNGAVPSSVNLDLGTAGQPFGTPGATQIGQTDGLSQFDSSYNVAFANQNGAPVGNLVSVAITEQGIVVASYSNGETQDLFQIPVADFPNPDGLRPITGNVFAQTRDSGEVNLREAGTNGVGTIVSAALEQSNVDLAEQLTDMIVAQRSYQANTRVIKTTDELLEQLNNI